MNRKIKNSEISVRLEIKDTTPPPMVRSTLNTGRRFKASAKNSELVFMPNFCAVSRAQATVSLSFSA